MTDRFLRVARLALAALVCAVVPVGAQDAGKAPQAAPQAAPIANLWRDNWDDVIWPATVAYSKLSYNELPAICRSCCIQRLSQINFICGEIEGGKSFF